MKKGIVLKKVKKKNKGFKMFCLISICFFGILIVKQQTIINNLNNEHKEYMKQKENLQLQGQQLKEELDRSKSKDYNEVLAREKLGLIKEGEILFIDKNRRVIP